MESQKRFLIFKDPKTKETDCVILYIDEVDPKKKTREITVPIQTKIYKVAIPNVTRVFYASDTGCDALFEAHDDIQKYAEALTGKNYSNEDVYVTVAPMGEDRIGIIY